MFDRTDGIASRTHRAGAGAVSDRTAWDGNSIIRTASGKNTGSARMVYRERCSREEVLQEYKIGARRSANEPEQGIP